MELEVRERADVAGLALPHDGGAGARARREVAIEAALADVERRAGEELRVGEVPLLELRPRRAEHEVRVFSRQNVSGSESDSSYIEVYAAWDCTSAFAENSADGGKRRTSFWCDSMLSLMRLCLPFVAPGAKSRRRRADSRDGATRSVAASGVAQLNGCDDYCHGEHGCLGDQDERVIAIRLHDVPPGQRRFVRCLGTA